MKAGRAMRTRRIELGLTQLQLAVLTNLSQELISQIERGMRFGSDDTQRRIAKALRVPITDLWPAAA